MPCFTPLEGYQLAEVNALTGKRSISFRKDARSWSGRLITLPCGRCVGCRRRRLFAWMIRLGHEASLHEHSYFVTLTYSEAEVPKTDAGHETLRLSDLQGFMKLLRNRIGAGVRFFACGEYGTRTLRPHYHVILFNADFEEDEYRFRRIADEGHDTFFSADVHEAWQYKGIISMSEVTPERCAYVAKYTTDKLTGERGRKYLERVGGDGCVSSVAPEFATMSRGGSKRGARGIGMGWIGNPTYAMQSVVHQNIVVRGHEHPYGLPNAYHKFLSEHPELKDDYEEARAAVRRERIKERLRNPEEYGSRRMRVKHELALRNQSDARARRGRRKGV